MQRHRLASSAPLAIAAAAMVPAGLWLDAWWTIAAGIAAATAAAWAATEEG